MAMGALFLSAAPTLAYTVTDFEVDPAHATLGDPHEVASPSFSNFQITLFGTFDVTKCYQVTIKREGGAPCGSANSSGTDTADVFADHLVADISPNAAADFKAAADWEIEIKERSAGCSGGSVEQIFPDSPGEPYLRIRGCNQTCFLSGTTLTVAPNPVGCAGTVQVCVANSGGGTLGSGNLEYDWDLNGDGTCGVCSGGYNNGKRCSEAGDCPGGVCFGGGGFTELTTHTGDPNCLSDQPCCVTATIWSAQSVGVKVRDLGTDVPCTECKTVFVTINNDCTDGQYCNGVEDCNGSGSCTAGTPPSCADDNDCTVDSCVEELAGGSCPCSGGVTSLTLRFDGTSGSTVVVKDNNGALVIFNSVLNNGDSFTLNGSQANGKFIKNDLMFYINDTLNTTIHVSCSQPIGIGFQFGSFTVQAFTSLYGGTFTEPCPCKEDDKECKSGTPSHTCTHTPSDALCDDGNFCNGAETCSATQGCQPGTPPNCADGVACTVDSCNESTDSCTHTPDSAACSDGLFCNGAETCDPVQGCLGGAPPNCDDGVACTIDSCDEENDTCAHAPNNTACDDGLYCNGVEVCDPVLGCRPGTPVNCDDGIPCTTDSCNEAGKSCTHTPNNSLCNDGQYCNGAETCSLTLGCVAGTPPNCDDAIACTTDACNETTDTCTHTPNNTACGDGLFCNGAEVCDPSKGCKPGTPPNCSDGVACTTDTCNETTDSCDHTTNNAACDDGQFCNGIEVCHATLGCQGGSPPNCDDGVACTADACNESTDTCDHTPGNAACDDGLYCNGAEVCDPVLGCQAGSPPNCSDGVACTTDTCNEATDSCDHLPNDTLCSDGQFCNGVETCHATLGCQAGTPPNCDDGVTCTVDGCDEIGDQCTHTPNDVLCDNGLYCDGQEVCDPVLGCQDAADPCNPPLICDEPNDRCVTCLTNAQCDDGVFCNGVETCNATTGVCQPGAPPGCDDGVVCTVDSCNTATDSCEHTPDHGACGDGLYCNGAEICHPTLGCQGGTPPNCDDGVACTVDVCNEATDTCDHSPNDGACSDGQFCDGVETCHPTLGCQSGTPPNCNDGVPCTIDSCDEALDACAHAPTDSLCDDGQYCNGAEVCDPVNGCQAGTPPDCNDGVGCTVDACDEATDTCKHTASNALCSDGQFCNGNESCDPVNGCQPGTPPNCDDGVACTTDNCNEMTDTCDHTPSNAACGDGQFCNGAEVCDPVNGCQPGTPPNCDDAVACTTDTCNEATDSCDNTPNNAACSDGQYCNGTEVCDAVNGCLAGAGPNCDDGVACTVDACDEANDICTHTPGNSACEDGQFCNGVESCHPTLGCQSGTPPSCDDGVACTTDACDEANDACTHTPNDSLCDNGSFCDGEEYCDPALDCRSGSPPCNPPLICDEPNDRCVECISDVQCDDGVFCNGVETCNVTTGVCQPGTPPSCDDGVACTVDACNPATDGCGHSPSNAACSDGQFCNGAEVCDPINGCQPGTPPDCNDGVACTVDSCDEANDRCKHKESDTLCSDGQFCNGGEVCDPVNGCEPGTPPVCDDGVACTIDSCDEAADSCVFTPNDGACSDGQYCNGTEVCHLTLGCQAGTPPDCNDGVACTTDACNEATDVCDHTPSNAACDDGLYCNGVEFCDPVNGCQAGTPPNCSDGVACTVDSCDETNDVCLHTPNDEACSDGQFCDGVEFCDPVNGCQAGTPPDCSDGVGCTVDTCDEVNDVCVHTPNNDTCDDGQFCNGVEFCDPVNGCQSGTPLNCDDGVGCTIDSCDEIGDVCVHAPDHDSCDDGQFCDGQEICDVVLDCQEAAVGPCDPTLYCDEIIDACVECLSDVHCFDSNFCNGVDTCVNGICVHGPPPACDDGIACTADACDPVSDSCIHTPSDSLCNDGAFCNGVETCSAMTGCVPGTPPSCDDGVACTVDVCDAQADTCVHTPNHGVCSDGLFCNGSEVCDPIQGCRSGAPVNCDDGVGCTVDSCDETNDVCLHSPNSGACDDGQFCNGGEVCDPLNGCMSGPPVNCSDGVACTVDACNEDTDSCAHAPNHGACSDGQFCNGVEACDPVLGCQAGPPVNCDDDIACTTDTCNESKDLCIHSPNNGACSDGQFCNGPEICTPGIGCQAGAPPDCDDGVGCTADSCDEANDRCVNTPDAAVCDDGQYCNGVEVCDPVNGCQAGAPPNCNDGVGCTIDSCDEANNTCVHAPNSGLCDDGLFCNGVETCQPGVGCQAGSQPNCADAIVCTTDSCDEINDKCVHTANAGLCNDGDACTLDSCATTGCSHANICGACCLATGNCVDSVTLSDCLGFPGENLFNGVGSLCAGDADDNGLDDACDLGGMIPTVSEWGLVILTLLLLTGAKVYFGTRRQAA